MMLRLWLGLSSLLATSLAYPTFQDRIPNGKNIKHPCKVNGSWPGVGHLNPDGGGPRNMFGLAFAAAGFNFTTDLCTLDSDGDGRTNGEELGDPSCIWTVGATPSRATNLSHPGICDPFDSEFCKGKNSFVSCDLQGFEACETIKQPGVMTLDLRFPQTRVPPTETNYFCMTFDLPSDQDYHIIANEPIKDNINVLHHMLLFGCNNPDDAYIPTPQSCGMSAQGKCGSIISGWTVGLTGNCFIANTGFRFGQNGFKRVRLELHYNNPSEVTNYTDSSGLRLYYQPAKPEVQDLITFTTGQLLLEIPPGQSRVPFVAVCPSACTKTLITKPVNVTNVLNHMHYMGRSMMVEVFRDGVKIKDLSNEESYSYDSPADHTQNPPFMLIPGDEIKTTCIYNSLSKSKYVYYGEATSDEMCYGFVTMYPADAFTSADCYSFGSTDMCSLRQGTPIGQCDWVTFNNFTTNAKIFNDVMKNCNLDGFCRPECREVLKGLQNHPCLAGEAFKWVALILQESKEGLQFLGRLRSCPLIDDTECRSQCPSQCSITDNPFNGAKRSLSVGLVGILLTLMCVMFI